MPRDPRADGQPPMLRTYVDLADPHAGGRDMLQHGPHHEQSSRLLNLILSSIVD